MASLTQTLPDDDDPVDSTVPEANRRSSVRKELQTLLRTEDAVSIGGSLGLLLSGAAICFGSGLLFATVLTLVLNVFFDTSGIGWFGWFIVYWLLMVPLLLWQDRKSRTGYVVDVLGGADGRSEHQPITDKVGVRAIAEMLLWGPRSLVEGLAGVRSKWTARQNWVFKRAAQVVLELARHEGGVKVKQVMRPPEDMPILMAAISWLDKNDWIGQASEGDKLWLSTNGRKKLVERKWMPESNFRIVEGRPG